MKVSPKGPGLLQTLVNGWEKTQDKNRTIYHCPPKLGQGQIEIRGDGERFFVVHADYLFYEDRIVHVTGTDTSEMVTYVNNMSKIQMTHQLTSDSADWETLDKQYYLGIHTSPQVEFTLVPGEQKIKYNGIAINLDWMRQKGYAEEADRFRYLPQESIVFPIEELIKMQYEIVHMDITDPYYGQRIELKVREFFLLLCEKAEGLHDFLSEGNQSHFDLIEDVRRYLDDNWVNPPTVEELAKQFYLNKNKLQEGFKKVYHKTVYEVITDLRLTHAMNRLLTTSDSVEDIAKSVGYRSRANFYRNFKRNFGITPAEVRVQADRLGLGQQI